jgi:hypothetical protein
MMTAACVKTYSLRAHDGRLLVDDKGEVVGTADPGEALTARAYALANETGDDFQRALERVMARAENADLVAAYLHQDHGPKRMATSPQWRDGGAAQRYKASAQLHNTAVELMQADSALSYRDAVSKACASNADLVRRWSGVS